MSGVRWVRPRRPARHAPLPRLDRARPGASRSERRCGRGARRARAVPASRSPARARFPRAGARSAVDRHPTTARTSSPTSRDGLDAPLAALGWPPEGRPFRPHLTIARTDAAHGARRRHGRRGARRRRARLDRVVRGVDGRPVPEPPRVGRGPLRGDRRRSRWPADPRAATKRRCRPIGEALRSALLQARVLGGHPRWPASFPSGPSSSSTSPGSRGPGTTSRPTCRRR